MAVAPHASLLLATLAAAGCVSPLLAASGPTVAVVTWSGEPTDEIWGDWSAPPGSVNVTSRTLLRLATAERATVAMAGDAFVGQEDPAWSIPIPGNLEMGWSRAASPPPAHAFHWTRDAAVTVPADAAHDQAFVAYRILRVGSPLPAQPYRAGYEVGT